MAGNIPGLLRMVAFTGSEEPVLVAAARRPSVGEFGVVPSRYALDDLLNRGPSIAITVDIVQLAADTSAAL